MPYRRLPFVTQQGRCDLILETTVEGVGTSTNNSSIGLRYWISCLRTSPNHLQFGTQFQL